jgi:hypothetical protein
MADAKVPGQGFSGRDELLRCVFCGKRVGVKAARAMEGVPCPSRDGVPCERLYDRWIEAAKGRSHEDLSKLPAAATRLTKQFVAEIEALD